MPHTRLTEEQIAQQLENISEWCGSRVTNPGNALAAALRAAYATNDTLQRDFDRLSKESGATAKILVDAGAHIQGGYAPDGYYDTTLPEMAQEIVESRDWLQKHADTLQAELDALAGEPVWKPTHRSKTGLEVKWLWEQSEMVGYEWCAMEEKDIQKTTFDEWFEPITDVKESEAQEC